MSENNNNNNTIATVNNDNIDNPSDSENDQFHDTVAIEESEEEQEMATVNVFSNIKLQPFIESEPEMWFDQMEVYLECKGISDPADKFKVLHAFGGETLVKFTYRFKKEKTIVPAGSTAFEEVKKQIINAYSQSEDTKLQELFKCENLAGIKPQQLAMKIREKANGAFTKPALKSLFMASLPTEVRQILCISEIDDLDKLATMADRIISTTKGPTQAVNKIDSNKSLNMAQLQEQLEKLTEQVQNLSYRGRGSQSGNSHNRSRSKSQNREYKGKNSHFNPDWCYWHNKFKNDSNRCQKPCTWNRNANSQKN